MVDRAGGVLGRHAGHHAFTVGQRRGIGVFLLRAAMHVVEGRPPQPGGRRSAGGARHIQGRDRARGAHQRRSHHFVRMPRHQPSRAIDGTPAAGAHARLGLALDQEVGTAPGQTACLLDGELVVGWGTVAGANG